jgi:hypothetical protein
VAAGGLSAAEVGGRSMSRWFGAKSKSWEEVRFEHRWDRLANYNSEVARGIVHTPEWDAEMAIEQSRHHEEIDDRLTDFVFNRMPPPPKDRA